MYDRSISPPMTSLIKQYWELAWPLSHSEDQHGLHDMVLTVYMRMASLMTQDR